jgi:heme-degrading monooxygenase HmoA
MSKYIDLVTQFERSHRMTLEVAPLTIRSGQAADFEAAFRRAQPIIASMPGYVCHELARCLARPDEFVLLVRWESLEAHEIGFRQSHRFYEPFPVVSHYATVQGAVGGNGAV